MIMTRVCVLLASAILVLGGATCRAKDAAAPHPTTSQTAVVVPGPACEGQVLCPHLHKLWGWLTYCPLERTCACVGCKCDPYYCAPPLYTFFLDHCAGGCGGGCCTAAPATGEGCGCGHGTCSLSHR